MKKVKIYEVTQTEAYQMSEQGTGFSLYPYGKETDYYKGYDDGGQEYYIPEGYTVEQGQDGQMHFYDNKDSHCELVSRFGKPALVADDDFLLLKKV